MEDDNDKLKESNEKIEIVSADLLNPFGNVKKINEESVKKDEKDTSKDIENDFYQAKEKALNNNINNSVSPTNTISKNIVNIKKDEVSNEDDFYGNFKNNSSNSVQNNKEVINIQNNTVNDLPERKSSVIFIVLSIIGFGIEFLNGYFVLVGLGLLIISFIGSIIMYRKLAKYALLSMIISFILIAITIFLIVVSYKEFNKLKNKIDEPFFRNSASDYINAAKLKFNHDNVSCDNNTIKYYLYELSDYYKENFFKLDEKNSFVLIYANMENDKCVLDQHIYITNDDYSIGTPDNPIGKYDISSVNINKK